MFSGLIWAYFSLNTPCNVVFLAATCLIMIMSQASSADSQQLNKISKMKGRKGRVNMLNLNRSVPKGCDERLLSELSRNKAEGDEALTELLKRIQSN